MGIKMIYLEPSCTIKQQSVFMAVCLRSALESNTLTIAWMICEAKSEKSKVSVSLSMVSIAVLQLERYCNSSWMEGRCSVTF